MAPPTGSLTGTLPCREPPPLPLRSLWISQAEKWLDNVYYVNCTHKCLICMGALPITRHCDSAPGALNARYSQQAGDLRAVLALELPAGRVGSRLRGRVGEGL